MTRSLSPRRSRSVLIVRAALALSTLVALPSCSSDDEGPGGEAERAVSVGQALEKARPVVIRDGGLRLVLERGVEEAWTTGAPKALSLDSPLLVSKEVDLGAVPEEHRAWIGRRVTLVGFEGKACEGTVTRLSVLGRAEAGGYVQMRWNGEIEGEPTPSADEIVEEAWQETSDGQLLTAEVTADGACDGAVWAQPAGQVPREIVRAVGADEKLEASVLEAMRKLPAYEDIQARYVSEALDTEGDEATRAGRWETEASAKVQVLRIAGQTLVWAKLEADGGCGGFNASLGVVFEMGSQGQLTLRSDPENSLVRAPEGAADIDGDGVIELIVPEGTVKQEGGLFVDEQALEVPYHGCPC